MPMSSIGRVRWTVSSIVRWGIGTRGRGIMPRVLSSRGIGWVPWGWRRVWTILCIVRVIPRRWRWRRGIWPMWLGWRGR